MTRLADLLRPIIAAARPLELEKRVGKLPAAARAEARASVARMREGRL